MAVTVTLNGVSYSIPNVGNTGWGAAVTSYLVAQATGLLSKAGGTFTLTADANFGATYGLKAAYFSTRSTASTAGVVRLGNNESIGWRNQLGSADKLLKVNTSNILEFDGAPVVTLALGSASTALRMNSGGTAYEWAKLVDANIDAAAAIAWTKIATTGAVVNADVNASAAIAYSKLALTGGIVNADVNASAAIAWTKIATSGAVVNADVNASAAIAYSKLNLSGSILNADVNASAAIAYSKLALTGSILNADINASAAIAWTKIATTGAVVNADVNASAAIAWSKIATSGAVVNADVNASAAIAYSKLNLSGSIATADLASGLLVPLTKGGTGQTTANAALNALLPSQASASGKVLSSNGTDTSWAAALTTTLSSAHVFVGNGSNVATDVAVTGDVTISNAGVTSLASTISGAKTFSSLFTASSGITFGGTTLANYAETTFTPTLLFTGTNSTSTISSASGRTTRIGRLVFAELTFTLNISGSPTGNFQIGGLDVTSNATFDQQGLVYQNNFNHGVICQLDAPSATLIFFKTSDNTQITVSGLATSIWRVTIVYTV